MESYDLRHLKKNEPRKRVKACWARGGMGREVVLVKVGGQEMFADKIALLWGVEELPLHICESYLPVVLMKPFFLSSRKDPRHKDMAV